MGIHVSFRARGHPNIRSSHETTFMTTKEDNLSTRGNCIIVISANMGLIDLPEETKKLAKSPETRITFRMVVGKHVFEATGYGHPDLEYSDPNDMVARRSNFTCGRTLMINCDKTSQDLPDELVEALKSPKTLAEITLSYE